MIISIRSGNESIAEVQVTGHSNNAVKLMRNLWPALGNTSD